MRPTSLAAILSQLGLYRLIEIRKSGIFADNLMVRMLRCTELLSDMHSVAQLFGSAFTVVVAQKRAPG